MKTIFTDIDTLTDDEVNELCEVIENEETGKNENNTESQWRDDDEVE